MLAGSLDFLQPDVLDGGQQLHDNHPVSVSHQNLWVAVAMFLTSRLPEHKS